MSEFHHASLPVMTEPDEAEVAAERLQAALARIAHRQSRLEAAARAPKLNAQAVSKLDNLIRALRDALEA